MNESQTESKREREIETKTGRDKKTKRDKVELLLVYLCNLNVQQNTKKERNRKSGSMVAIRQ